MVVSEKVLKKELNHLYRWIWGEHMQKSTISSKNAVYNKHTIHLIYILTEEIYTNGRALSSLTPVSLHLKIQPILNLWPFFHRG